MPHIAITTMLTVVGTCIARKKKGSISSIKVSGSISIRILCVVVVIVVVAAVIVVYYTVIVV